jgi:hypothetical protein
MTRWNPLREFAIILGIALPGFLACSIVYVAIDPIATNRWRPIADDAAQSLALVTIVAYLAAGVAVAAFSADPDVAWGGCSIVTVFSLGILLPIWVGLGGVAASQQPLFQAVLWLQPVLAIGAYLLGVSIVVLLRRILTSHRREQP